jgi:hypothetical protein
MMTDENVGNYMASSAPTVTVTNSKKRKAGDKDEHDALKKRARVYCKTPQAWKSISRYSHKRLEEYVFEQEFQSQQVLQDSIFSFAHTILALGLDVISKGNGFVREELENDLSLRESIEVEGARFVSYLNHRWRILALTSKVVFTGKRIQLLTELPLEKIVELDESTNESTTGQDDHEIRQQELDTEDVHDTTSGNNED